MHCIGQIVDSDINFDWSYLHHSYRREDIVLVEEHCVVRPDVVVKILRPPLFVAQVLAVVGQPRLVYVVQCPVKNEIKSW